jgi:hypothetical protein
MDDTAGPSLPASDPRQPASAAGPWIETREGMIFFTHCVLIAPQFVVLFPLMMGWLVAPIGAPDSLLNILATIPTLAAFALPYAGWLFIVPAWFAWKARKEMGPPLARHFLGLFALLHLGFVVYAAWFWLTGQSFPPTG